VGFREEVVLSDKLQGDVQGAVVKQDGTEEGALGFQVVRDCPLG
jgi:hypothetical protein